METPEEHIERLRASTFSIGRERNPLAPMLDQAVKYLSAELYAKDVHFLMELIQNAEDNEYVEGVDPSLEFVLTSRDITNTGAPATLLVFNNEKGFSAENVNSICAVGNSTKKGNRKRGYIGEKGIGFKSVFLISAQPYIFSNGYQIRFNENPCPHCELGYIVPEWVHENPSLSDIKQIYGSDCELSNTTLILPLKPDKVKAVKHQLSSIHPEVLLFLTKIKRLSAREHNEDPRLNTVSAIAITKETNFVTRKNIDAESYTLHLSAEEESDEFAKECSYYLWKQKFPVRQENRIDRRMEVEDWVITLAFSNGERLLRGLKSTPGIYAFLPTEMVSNFPFIIQADFILASSRETIQWDNIWNQGILDCVPFAFINALISLIKTVDDAPGSSLPPMFKFLPVHISPFENLDIVRESIRSKLAEEDIVPSESHTRQKFFHKPREVFRLIPDFRNILKMARERVSLYNLSSHGYKVLDFSFDKPEYDDILEFLGVVPVSSDWYVKCIQGSNIVMGVSEETYLELLHFLAVKWHSWFYSTSMGNIPIIKYVDVYGNVSLSTVNESAQRDDRTLCLSREQSHVSWLIDWNREFRCKANHFFLPRRTQEAICSSSNKTEVLKWLEDAVEVTVLSVNDYAVLCGNQVGSDRKLVIAYAHFLYHSFSNDYLSGREVASLCDEMPLVDSYGDVIKARKAVLVPATESKWVQLIGSNPWREDSYVELGEDYLHPGYFAGTNTEGKQLMGFLKAFVKASDIPHIAPPNDVIPTASTHLTKQNAFLLLDWIRELKRSGNSIPARFMNCIREGEWLKITMNGSSGYKPPSQSFLLGSDIRSSDSDWGNILQNGSVLVDIPLIDQDFYGHEINEYREELRTVGVMFEYGEACAFIGNRLMSLADSSTLTKTNVISTLNFIRFLTQNFLSPDKFILRIKEGRWLKTSRGDRSPVGSVLYDQEWTIATQISDIPFIDEGYYGEDILRFKQELRLLGVLIDFSGNYQLIADYLKSPPCLSFLTMEAFLLVLDCIRHSSSAGKLVIALKNTKCLKTNLGYRYPDDCFLFHPEWGCLLNVFGGVPLVDSNFYGSDIISYKKELKDLGVRVDFNDVVKEFLVTFRKQASSMTKESLISFISCYRKLKGTQHKFPSDLKKCIREENWLRTRLGDYRSPSNCILFGPEWESIDPITCLPFIDDSDKYYGNAIHEYQKELKKMGVVVEFKAGAEFVAAGLCFPQDPCSIDPMNVFSLLECIRALLQEKNYSFPEIFLKNISQSWLKTHAGFRSPGNCCLFNSQWSSYVKPTDGPFIDEDFYGSNIKLYGNELSAIGVCLEEEKACSLLASHLDSLSEFSYTIPQPVLHQYDFLRQHKWKPDGDATRKIWIPDGLENGMWVNPEECVLHDEDGFFGLQLNVLEKHYEPELLPFFSSSFKVRSNPSFDDYCKLWKVWESLRRPLTHAECCAFWKCVLMHRSSKTERTLAEDLVKLPVVLGSGEILLFRKGDVFIADDLLLKDLFERRYPSRPIFVWCPQPNSPSLPRTSLLDVYKKIGVRTISESVQKEELSLADGVELRQMNSRDVMIGKELVRLILGFLADPSLDIEATKRHGAVQCLLNLKVLETMELIAVSYSLSLSDGEILKVKVDAKSMIRWDKECSKFLTQKMDEAGGQKSLIEYATFFSDVISRGVLWDKEDKIKALSELTKLAFVLKFDEQAVQFLMKSNNLQTFQEDEEFLAAAFPSV